MRTKAHKKFPRFLSETGEIAVYMRISALAELRSATGGLQTVLLQAVIEFPLRRNAFSHRSFVLTSKLTSNEINPKRHE